MPMGEIYNATSKTVHRQKLLDDAFRMNPQTLETFPKHEYANIVMSIKRVYSIGHMLMMNESINNNNITDAIEE